MEGSVQSKAAGWQARSRLDEIALVLVRLDHVAFYAVSSADCVFMRFSLSCPTD
jgi:hypothetical protein